MNKHESEFQELIEQLGVERPSAPEPNHAFTTDLRGQLLEQYEQGAGWEISFSNLVSAATALAVLALVVLVGWFLNSSQQQPTVVGEVIQTTRVAETAVEATTSNVTHTTLQISRFVDETYTWNATVEHWQTADGLLNRTLVTDEDGQLDHYAQNDERRLYIGNSLNPIFSPNRRLQSYFELNTTAPDQTKVDQAGQPPFYSDLGWDGLATLLISSKLDCSTYECIEQMVEPALVAEGLQRSQAYGWASSLMDTVEENGRTVHIFHIAYNDGLSSEAFPQYRQAKIDANSYEVISIQDYDGDKLWRSVELVSREQVNSPLTEFRIVPEIVEQTVMNGYVDIVNFGPIHFSGYGWSVWPTTGSPNPLVFNIFWQADKVPDNELTSFVHIFDESGGLVFQNDAVLQWDAPMRAGERFTAHFSLEKQLSNGRYQVQVGVYDTVAGQRLTTDEGETVVQVDEIIIDK